MVVDGNLCRWLSNTRGAIVIDHACSQQVSRNAVPMTDTFWRLSAIDYEKGCILISAKTVQRLDWRVRVICPSLNLVNSPILQSPNDYIDIFNICSRNDLLTAVKGPYKDHLIRLCSTKEILWLDSRFTRSPLLGYRHGRAFDRTLETRTVFLPGLPHQLYFLHHHQYHVSQIRRHYSHRERTV